MKTSTKVIIATSLLLATTVPAYAGHGHKNERFIERIEKQQGRIEHGIDNRELTRWEAKSLRKEQREIRHLFRDFREDKRLSKKERRILSRKLDRASERIWEFKHNEYARIRGHHKHNRYSYEWDEGRGSHHRHTRAW